MSLALHVNVDHVATLRQARGTRYPDPVEAALACERAGADGITVHLREDRRHIQERDVRVIKEVVRGTYNLEMAASDDGLAIALAVRPDHVTLVPERRELFGTMSVEDNLVLGAFRQVRQKNKLWREQIHVVYELFPRLLERRTQVAGTLSGGERQMLAVGRALMARPVLLMLDEPSLGLAPLVVKEIFRTIDGLRTTGVTTLLVEQNARAALETADDGYVLEMGEIALHGPANELATDSRVIDTYLGTARKKEAA